MLIYDVNNVIYYTLMQCSNTNKTEASLKIKISKEVKGQITKLDIDVIK